MSKRTILILTYHNPESDGEELVQLAVVAAPTKKQALTMLKAQAKESFKKLEEESGNGDDYKLSAYKAFAGRHAVGESIGHFEIMGTDGSGPCDDSFIVYTSPTLLIV